MKDLKSTLRKFALLPLVGLTLALPVAALAEDPVPAGTTVKTIPLTTLQYKVSDASGQVVANQPLSSIVSSAPAPSAPAPVDSVPAPDAAPVAPVDAAPGVSPVSPADTVPPATE